MKPIAKLIFRMQLWYLELLISLMPSVLYAYVLNEAVKQKLIVREQDGVKYQLVWEKVDE